MGKVFALSEGAYQRGTDYDIVMLYQVLLGRNPESSQVILEHKSNPLNMAFATFVRSEEFRESVMTPLAEDAPVLRHDSAPKPSAEQLNWLFSRTILDDEQKAALRAAGSWEQFFRILTSLEGFLEPLPPPLLPPLAPPPLVMPRRAMAPVIEAQPAGPMPPAPSLTEIAARLTRIEALLETLLSRLPAQDAAPAAADAAEPEPKVKPSNRRQAR